MGVVLGGLLSSLGILSTWAVLALAFAGIGLGIQRWFGVRGLTSDDLIRGFWVGFATVLLLLQLWNLKWPVTAGAFAVVALLGVVGLVWSAKDLQRWCLAVPWRGRRVEIAVLALAALWIANRSMDSPNTYYDTGMYHYPVVKWLTSYSVVPGLANLNGPLAFNNVHLLYAAMLDWGPWTGLIHHVANGLLLGAVLLQIMWSVFRLLRASPGHRSRFVFDLLLLLPALRFVLTAYTSSLATDPIPAVLLWVVASLLFAILARPEAEPHRAAYGLLAVTVLCTASPACKMNGLGFAAAAWLLALVIGWQRLAGVPALRRRLISWAVAISILFGGVWTARSVILSGYPAFPSTIAPFPVEWRAPKEMGDAERGLITHRARFYYDRMADRDVGGPWLKEWARHLVVPLTRLDYVILPMVISLIAGLVWLVKRRSPGQPSPGWLLLIPTVAGLALWFATAPNPRFGSFLFWILAATAVAAAFDQLGRDPSRAQVVALILAGLGIAFWPLAAPARAPMWDTPPSRPSLLIGPGPDHGFRPMMTQKVGTFVTQSGLTLNYPLDQTLRCWDAPLPCTPYRVPNLRLRGNDLASGFETVGPWDPQQWPNPGSRFLERWRAARAGR